MPRNEGSKAPGARESDPIHRGNRFAPFRKARVVATEREAKRRE